MRKAWPAIAVIVVLAGVLAVISVARRTAPRPSGKVRAAATIPPVAWFVERVGGAGVEVEVLLRPGQSPHSFEPRPAQVEWLARSQVYFTVGMPLERQLAEKTAGAEGAARVVDASRGIQRRAVAAGEAAHEDDEHAEKGEPDPHVWLNPLLAKTIAANICSALKEIDPARAGDYEQNLRALEADLDALHARITEKLAPVKGRELFVFHPAFGYFADAYGLRQVAVEAEGKSPAPRQVAELIKRAREAGAKAIFVQPQYPVGSAEVIAREIGGTVQPIDDLPRDYIASLEQMAEKIRESLSR